MSGGGVDLDVDEGFTPGHGISGSLSVGSSSSLW
jgi:hypothetical protein